MGDSEQTPPSGLTKKFIHYITQEPRLCMQIRPNLCGRLGNHKSYNNVRASRVATGYWQPRLYHSLWRFVGIRHIWSNSSNWADHSSQHSGLASCSVDVAVGFTTDLKSSMLAVLAVQNAQLGKELFEIGPIYWLDPG
jgi:hypothetical protein